MKYLIQLILISLVCCALSCEKLVKVSPPVTRTNGDNLFYYDPVVISAVTGIYVSMSTAGFGTAGDIRALNACASLYSDELTLFSGPNVSRVYQDYYNNALSGQTNGTGGNFWNTMYTTIYKCNSIIQGLSSPNSISTAVSKQLMGEMLFTRALCYYYLVNLYGDVAWIDGIDYTINSVAKRTSSGEVLKYLVDDLKLAKDLLSINFLDASLIKGSNFRYRPTTYAASALLTKIFLLLQDWGQAEDEASRVIANSQLFSLDSLSSVFLVTSKEAIWQLQVVSSNAATEEGNKFILPSTGASESFPFFLSGRQIAAFEKNDRRKQIWVGTSRTYNYPYKYKVATATGTPTEALTMLRLADIYLNRAEARARANKLSLATDDINLVRTRAWLPKIVGVDANKLLDTILHERQVEMFTEFGNRFIDLKRFQKIDKVMPAVCAEKGTTWKSSYSLFPFSASELQANPNLQQNPGY
ncbi:Starch-binding associating with outer membrane [Chitinophaga jiangningensis]|uniref:Starch-binding associating with outer membrane n=1 Tax=Chitinophaga jiangningensis TaxID=1419482 RepID=A0A1M7BUM3_9BACT|nr:RagB/SusD family nutrient uptake outer membrane protein [Chitinophaga jiangningensis]SHL58637.1 Starch-binding associating with outer membrane [Chitinophaga jiangningensis]